jgi:hypothetical protein
MLVDIPTWIDLGVIHWRRAQEQTGPGACAKTNQGNDDR